MILAGLALLGAEPGEAWVSVPPSDPEIQWLGRVDLTEPASPRMAWSGSGFLLEFEGTGVVATLETFSQEGDAGTDRYAVRVDGGAAIQLEAAAGKHELVLAAGLAPGRHVLALNKTTEAMVGTGVLYALTLEPGGRLLHPHPGSVRRIEVVGDAVACGYGVRLAQPEPPSGFTPAHQDYLMAWPSLVGEELDAQVQTLCYSGRGVLRGHDGSEEEQLPVLWKRSLPHEAEAQWDFSRFIPEVVVLQIGAQDLATGRPPRRLYRAVLELWIQEIRARYPEAWILLTPSPTVTEQWPKGGWGPAWLQDRVSEQQRLAESRGDSRVRTFALSPVEGPWGEDYQPSAASQATLAREAVVVIRDFTGW